MNHLLETEGLGFTLQEFCRRFERTGAFQVHFGADPIPPLSAQAEAVILSTVEEAVKNAEAHAQAHNLWITARCQAENLHISIRDDGRGFDLEAALAEQKARGIDPAGKMRSRIEAIQGNLTLRSAVGEGTTLCVVLPLAPNES